MDNLNRLIEKFYQERDWEIKSLNITYLRDTNPANWTANPFAPDRWNCTRVLWQPDSDRLVMSCAATTRPGVSAVDNPMNANGTFCIKHDYLHKNCWEIGRHITRSSNQKALVQCDTLVGTRDSNKDYMLAGDYQYTDANGVNQHTTNNQPVDFAPDRINGYSFGCLVGAYPVTHYTTFMPALINSGLKLFNTGIIYSETWAKFVDRMRYVKS